MRIATVLGLSLVVGACGQGHQRGHMTSATAPTPMMIRAEGQAMSRTGAVLVPAPASTTRIRVTNLHSAEAIDGPTPVEGGIEVVFSDIELVCACPGGRRLLTLERLRLVYVGIEYLIDRSPATRATVSAEATIRGDWNGDGEEDRIAPPPFEGEANLVLREDDILAVRASGGGDRASWYISGILDRERRTFRLETLGITCGPIIRGD